MSTPAKGTRSASPDEGSFRIPDPDAGRSDAAPAPAGAGAPSAEEQASFRLDALAPAGMEGYTEAPSKPRIPMQVVFVGALLLAAAGALMAMRKYGMAMTALGDIKIDYDYTKGSGAGDHHRILQDLEESNVAQQVPAEEVQKNPFSMVESKLALAPAADTTPSSTEPGLSPEERLARQQEEKRRQEEQARQQEILSKLASLQIHGIMTGDSPVARIGDETVRVGDTVAGMFTVAAIEGRSVTLEADGKTYSLSLDDRGRAPKPPSRPTSIPPSLPPRK